MLGAEGACCLGGSPAKTRGPRVRMRSMGTAVRTMIACMGIPFRWCGPWRSGALPRVWARVATESTAHERAQLPTGVKEVLAMFAPAASIARQGNIVDFNDYKRTH